MLILNRPVAKLSLVAMLTTINVLSRIYMTFLPNFKPVTCLIIFCLIHLGLKYALLLSFSSMVISNVFLGFGIWTAYQIGTYFIICIISYFFLKLIPKKLIFLAAYIFLMGYVYGFLISFERLLHTNFYGFLTYYIAGISFDTLHALGNLTFTIVFYPVFKKLFHSNFG